MSLDAEIQLFERAFCKDKIQWFTQRWKEAHIRVYQCHGFKFHQTRLFTRPHPLPKHMQPFRYWIRLYH